MQHLAKRAFPGARAVRLRPHRLPMMPDGKIYVIEANPNPQLAQDEDFAQSAKNAGIPYGRLLERIMAIGLQWQPTRMAFTPEG